MFTTQTPPPVIQPARPHRIRITLSDPSELQITQGQQVSIGDILAERTAERIYLLNRRTELQGQLLELDSTLPPTDLNLQQRIQAYQQAHTAYDQHYRLIAQLQASEVAPYLLRQEIIKLQSLYTELLNTHTQAQRATRQHQQDTLNYTLTQDSRRQILTGQLQLLNQELAALTIRAPFDGSISRIQWVEQTNNQLTVEVTIQP
jgi:multidrug resistance efflux pump